MSKRKRNKAIAVSFTPTHRIDVRVVEDPEEFEENELLDTDEVDTLLKNVMDQPAPVFKKRKWFRKTYEEEQSHLKNLREHIFIQSLLIRMDNDEKDATEKKQKALTKKENRKERSRQRREDKKKRGH